MTLTDKQIEELAKIGFEAEESLWPVEGRISWEDSELLRPGACAAARAVAERVIEMQKEAEGQN